MTELLTTYDPYFAEPRNLAPGERYQLLCVEDRPPEDQAIEPDIQIAGAGNGLVYDLHFALQASRGKNTVPLEQLTPLVLQTLGTKIAVVQHGNVCGGEAAMPDIPRAIAQRDPQFLINTVNSFGLGIEPSMTERMIELAREHHATNATTASPMPDIETAANRVKSAEVSRVPVVGRHLARVVIINNTADRFRNRSAWEEGNPAYVLSAGGLESLTGDLLSATGANPQAFWAFTALRHIVTVQERLRHPNPDEALSILVRNPSLARA